jgi:hypothetical protein
VTLKVKVTNISEVTKQTIRSGQQLDKCVATLSDHSGSTPYTIWDKDLGRISLLKCYTICDASVRSFNGKALTTCPTTIVEIVDIGIVKYTEEEKDIQEQKILYYLCYAHIYPIVLYVGKMLLNIIKIYQQSSVKIAKCGKEHPTYCHHISVKS